MLRGYCEGNSSIAQAWVQQGFQPCFFFTLVPAVLLSVCLLLGALQYACYVRFGRAMEPKYIPRSRLYHSQVLLSLLLALQPFGGLLWQVGGPGRLYGYMLLHAFLWALSWGCAIALLQLEHTRVLAHDRTRGHGTVLLLFWALAFAAENLTLVCWRSPLWWWALEDTNQKVGWGGCGQGRGMGPFAGGGGGCSIMVLGWRVHAMPCHAQGVRAPGLHPCICCMSQPRAQLSHISPCPHPAQLSLLPGSVLGAEAGGVCLLPTALYPPGPPGVGAPQAGGQRPRHGREEGKGLGAVCSQRIPLSCVGCPPSSLAALHPIPLPCSLPLSAHVHLTPGADCSADPPLSIQVQFGFWLLRYVCTFVLFILGMKAPGLPHKPYMLLVNEEERDVENSQVSPRAGAVWEGCGWRGAGDKMEIQLPWDQHLQESREERGLGLLKFPACCRQDAAPLGGWRGDPGRTVLVFLVECSPGPLPAGLGCPDSDPLLCSPPATLARQWQDHFHLEGFPEEAAAAGAIHVAEG